MEETFKPTAEMASAAKRALRWIEEGYAGSGFTDVGRRRAVQLSNRQNLSLDTVKRMASFFARHEVDKKGENFDNLSKPSAGRVAWDAWGGDSGQTWANRIVNSMNDKAVSANASIYARIVKSEMQADGTCIVTGVATDDTLDVDQQVCDPDWLKRAMPDWFKWGNIREQHSHIAAGVATEYELKGDQHWITCRVVDPNSVRKVEAGVLKGFSIGIRNPRVMSDTDAPGGRIVDGDIVEVSLVDRPANPSCLLSLAKSVNGEITQVEELTEKEANMDCCAKCDKTCKGDCCDKCNMGKAVSEESTESTEASQASEMSSSKAADEESTAMNYAAEESSSEQSTEESVPPADKAAAEESSQQVGEESSQQVGEESSRPGGVAGVAGKSVDLEAKIDLLAEKVDNLLKFCEANIVKADDSSAKDIAKAVTAVTERLSQVEKSASRGPARMAVTAKPATPNNDIELQKAAYYREKAMTTSDPKLASGYIALALEHETKTTPTI